MKWKHLLLIVFLPLLNNTSAHGQHIYVHKGATGTNDGTTWANAFANLQDALNTATAGDEIWVAEGTYLPDSPDGSRASSFLLDKNLKLYGGFSGTERNLEERGDPADFPTILSGDLNGDDIADDLDANREDNAWTVLTVNADINSETVIDGFTIRNGHSDDSGSSTTSMNGGGMYCTGAPIVTKCWFEENHAVNSGGGLYLLGNSTNGISIEHCVFEKNRADNEFDAGAGLYVTGAIEEGVNIDQCEFRFNEGGRGSGVASLDANLTVTNTLFFNNTNLRQGGGLWFLADDAAGLVLKIEDCIFEGNHSSFGGAIYSLIDAGNTSIEISRTRFEENVNSPNPFGWGQAGGGLYFVSVGQASNLSVSVDSCLFQGNTTTGTSSALEINLGSLNQSVHITNSTFLANNTTGKFATASVWSAQGSNGQVVVENCTFESNTSAYSCGLDIGSRLLSGAMNFEVRNCQFLNNQADHDAGALTLWGDFASSPNFIVEECLMEGNTAGERAGAVWIANSSSNFRAALNRCQFLNNQSAWGGAIGVFRAGLENYTIPEDAVISIENSLISGNSSGNAAIAIDTFPEIRLLNTTVVDNLSDAILLEKQSGLTLQNTILYNPGFSELVGPGRNSSITSNGGNLIANSSLHNWLSDTDQVVANPLLDADFYPTEESPAVDAGIPYDGMPDVDLAGNDRIWGYSVDVGAYESPYTTSGTREPLADDPLVLAPNPANSFIKVDLPVFTQIPLEAQVLGLQGKVVAQQRLRSGELLNIERLPQGLYLVKIVADGLVYTGRFMKQF